MKISEESDTSVILVVGFHSMKSIIRTNIKRKSSKPDQISNIGNFLNPLQLPCLNISTNTFDCGRNNLANAERDFLTVV
jgi:hypothetical protein